MNKKLNSVSGFMNRRTKFPEEKDTWLISFSDIITMLLCFFMLFYSSQKKTGKNDFENLVAQLKEKFGINVTKDGKIESSTAETIEQRYGLKDLYSSLAMLDDSKSTKVLNFNNYISIEFPEGDMFASGSEKLLKNAQVRLLKVIEELSKYRGKVSMTVVAYTDPTPVIKNNNRWWSSNEELSALRALQAQRVFLENGFNTNEIYISGRGVRNFKGKDPLDLKGNEVNITNYNQFRTITVRIEAWDK